MIIKQDIKELPYESPQMTTIPIRTSGMLCLSAGNVYQNAEEADVLDFLREGSESENGNLNGRFTEWSDDYGNGSFF